MSQFQPGSQNLLTLWDKPVPVPTYPSFSYVLDSTGARVRDKDLRFIPDLTENMKFRALVRHRTEHDMRYREAQRMFCKSSILYFANVFCWTYDPRLEDGPTGGTVPFVTYPFQDDLLTWVLWLIHEHEDGVIEKSRDMGLTWCLEVIFAYMSVFFDGKTAYQMSLREDDVDSRTEDSLLGKLRFLLRNLPPWMRAGWVEKENDIDNKMMMKFPETRSLVRGQLSMGTSGRSGRATWCFNDEFAHVEDADKILKALSSLAPCNIFGSTPAGHGNAFAVMAHNKGTKKKTLHWRLHPMKNPEWARKERAKPRYTEESWAQEHEISYEQSTEGRVFPEFVSFVNEPTDWCHIQEGDYFEYDPNADVEAWMDFGIADPTAVLFAQRKQGPRHFEHIAGPDGQMVQNHMMCVFDCAQATNKDYKWWADLLRERGYRYSQLVGDYRTGNQRGPTGQTWVSLLAGVGFHIQGRYNTEFAPLHQVKVQLRIPGRIALHRSGAADVIKAVQNWAYPTEKDEDGITRIRPGSKPKHDQWSHFCKAFAYGIDWNYGRQFKRTERIEDEDDWDWTVLGRAANL